MARNLELTVHEALAEHAIFAELERIGEPWNHISVLGEVDSTNAHLERNLSRVVPGNPFMVTADEQTLGVGRLNRQWVSPFGAGIALTIGISQSDIAHELSAIPLISGLAVVNALNGLNIPASLKWPNDVVFLDSQGLRKVGGLLVRRLNNAVALGIGINVGLTEAELPVAHATSLAIEGFEISREILIAHIIQHTHNLLTQPVDWHSDYSLACSSLGRIVRIIQTDKVCFSGTALRVEPDGGLVLQTNSGEKIVTVGDVEHATLN